MRHALSLDIEPVMAAMWKLQRISPAEHAKHADMGAVRHSVVHAIRESRAYICNGFFIMVDVGRDWFSYKTFLIEQIIIKAYPTEQKVGTAIAALDDIAAEHGCDLIAVGDTQIGYMTPHYHAAGYKTLGTQLMKERTSGIRPKENGGPRPD